MIIRHLPHFAVIAEEENLQRAAVRLGISQPALSRRIRELESELGVLLFERVSGRLKLTPMGRRLGEESRRLVDEVEALARSIRSRSEDGLAQLAIGMNERAIVIPAVGSALRKFRKENPAVELNVKIMSSKRQLAALKERQVDLALMYHEDKDTVAMGSAPIRSEDPFLLVLPAGHRLAQSPGIAIADLDGEELIWPSRDGVPANFEFLMAKWRDAGLVPRITTEVANSEAALHAVRVGLGLALLRASVLPTAFPELAFRRVEELANDPLDLSAVWLERHGSAVLRRFLNLLGEFGVIEPLPTS